MSGWQSKETLTPELKPYFTNRERLSTHGGCLLWGSRVIVSNKLRGRVLEEVHEGHVGVVTMKGLSRRYVLKSHARLVQDVNCHRKTLPLLQ